MFVAVEAVRESETLGVDARMVYASAFSGHPRPHPPHTPAVAEEGSNLQCLRQVARGQKLDCIWLFELDIGIFGDLAPFVDFRPDRLNGEFAAQPPAGFHKR